MAITRRARPGEIFTGLAGHSRVSPTYGIRGDVFSSGMVLLASRHFKPAIRITLTATVAEILSGLLVGLVLASAGALISYGSFLRLGSPTSRYAGL